MAKCIRCKLEIKDDTMMCPLCNGVLVRDEEEFATAEKNSDGTYVSRSISYPDVAPALKRMQMAVRIAIFSAVIVAVVAMFVNYYTYKGVMWSLIVALGLAYGCFTLLYAFSTRRSLQRIIHVQALLAIIAMIALDYLTGHQGWAVKYAIPIALMVIPVGIVVMMIINVESWQSYIMTEISCASLSVVLLILALFKVINSTILLLIATGVSCAILAGTILFGSRLVSDEIKRRFRV